MANYQGKAGLVTGASKGIGRGTALCFAEAGAAVAVADIDEEEGQKTVDLISQSGGKAIFCLCDVSKADDVKRMVATTVDTFGSLDFAVNNAAIELEKTPLTGVTADIFDKLMAVNVKGVFFCLQQEILQMSKQGSGAICNIASINAYRPQPNASVYTATKAAVVGMTRNAAMEAASQGVRINAICPGATDTPMMAEQLKRVSAPKEVIIDSLSLIGRFARPEEIGKAALWICSDDASFVYGHALAVDGGYLAR